MGRSRSIGVDARTATAWRRRQTRLVEPALGRARAGQFPVGMFFGQNDQDDTGSPRGMLSADLADGLNDLRGFGVRGCRWRMIVGLQGVQAVFAKAMAQGTHRSFRETEGPGEFPGRSALLRSLPEFSTNGDWYGTWQVGTLPRPRHGARKSSCESGVVSAKPVVVFHPARPTVA